jgi:hypothetical protein
MEPQQKTRLDKIYSDRLYLIEYKQESEHWDFVISGSTANLYKIKLQTNQMSQGLKPLISCNCPDMFSWAKEYDLKCKHCCFVLIKVLRLPENWLISGEIERNPVAAAELINSKLQNLQLRAELTNADYVAKYQQIKGNLLESTSAHASGGAGGGAGGAEVKLESNPVLDKFKVTKELDGDEECPICFDSLEIVSSFQCPTCRNLVHQHCMEKWLSTGHKNCVYCRGDWSLLKNETKSSGRSRGRGGGGSRGGKSIASYYQNLG